MREKSKKNENMNYDPNMLPANVLHWNYRGFTEFPLHRLDGEESEITDIYLKENLISRVPKEICKLENLESLYLSGNDISELPQEISHLKCLKCLDLSGNRLKVIPDEIGEMRNLKFLILDENELTELPLRLNELRALRYLSVCDNQLQWIPQRPVYNYHHCEFRFWRNTRLMSIPYSLWYHMFRNQQTRSLNIGCLCHPSYHHTAKTHKIRLKITEESRERSFDILSPSQHEHIMENKRFSPPSLFELSRRVIYQMICDKAKRQTAEADIFSWSNYSSSERNLQQTFEGFTIDNNSIDINGNHATKPMHNTNKTTDTKSYYVPADVINKHFRYLPHFIRRDLCNGPISRCDNVTCRKATFDYVFYEFCFGKLILIDNQAEVLLTAMFCSVSCANEWKAGKSVIPWTIINN